jgi:signal transduction histidine kinase/CheY-like chemotaxis protein
MSPRDEEEEKLLRSVALQNAQSIRLARQRAEEELVRAKEALELKTQELAHSLAMMRATLESTTDGILVTDGGGAVTGFNRKFVEMWRLPREILDSGKHKHLLAVTSREFADPLQFLATVTDIYAAAPPESHDVLELADGRVFERFSRIQFVDDRNVGRVWSFREITDRKRAEIENANLLAALKESDRRKDEFLAILAHELRNPLAPIRNAVQILRAKGPPAPELIWARDVIDRQVHQMTRLVDDLLDVSRITRGKIQLHKERVELAAVVNSAVEASRPLIDKWRHEFTVTTPSEPIDLDADLTRLSQVLLNLLNNAAKYTERGGRIWLTIEREGDHVLLRVKDTGIGIPGEMLPRIFDMFTQVDRSLERAEGGLGIGLTLVQRLVEMHGGTVAAHSEGPGKGSEFVVRLPIATEAEAGDKAHPPGGPARDLTVESTRRILVVDDNQDAGDSLEMLLRNLGHDVRTAHDGLEAVDEAAAFQPDVVLLDIGLPKLNGYDVARRIRDQRGTDVVLIAVTGWGQAEDRRLSREAGFDHHLTKPINLDALQQLLTAGRSSRPD